MRRAILLAAVLVLSAAAADAQSPTITPAVEPQAALNTPTWTPYQSPTSTATRTPTASYTPTPTATWTRTPISGFFPPQVVPNTRTATPIGTRTVTPHVGVQWLASTPSQTPTATFPGGVTPTWTARPASAVFQTCLDSAVRKTLADEEELGIATGIVVTETFDIWFGLVTLVATNTAQQPVQVRIRLEGSVTGSLFQDVTLAPSATTIAQLAHTFSELALGAHTFRVYVDQDTNKAVIYQTGSCLMLAEDTYFVTAGDVVGPTASVDGGIPRFDGTDGKRVQESPCTISDSGNVTGCQWAGTVAGPVDVAHRLYSDPGLCDVDQAPLGINTSGDALGCAHVNRAQTPSSSHPNGIVTWGDGTGSDLRSPADVRVDGDGNIATTGYVQTGQLIATVTDLAPFVVSSTTKVASLNADLLDGRDWRAPGPIGQDTPDVARFTSLLLTSTTTPPMAVATTQKVDFLNADLLDGGDWEHPNAIGDVQPQRARFTQLQVPWDGSELVGHYTNTANLAFGALSAGTCVTGAVSIPQASENDVCALGLPQGLAATTGAEHSCWVASAGTVFIRRCNYSASPLADPGAQTVRVSIWKY